MVRGLIITLSLFSILLGNVASLNLTEYVWDIGELVLDEHFVEEYMKWSLELFSQPDYLYGKSPAPFPCSTEGMRSSEVPTSVHALRPGDIECVAAIGDSLTAGLGAHAHTPLGLFGEVRGVAWSIGGDKTYDEVLTLPNILRLYNPQLKGFSTKTSIAILNGQNAKHNGLNVAKSGARSYHMVEQADLLLDRLKNKNICNWNDWKLITFFVGGNDLCDFCTDVQKHDPVNYIGWIRDTLDRLYNANLPRTLVNLVVVLDVRSVKQLSQRNFVCKTLYKRSCPCAAYPTEEQEKILNEWVPQYQQGVFDLINTGRYDGRDDFTVVVQPFLAETVTPRKDDGEVDFSYFAPDCFHFSGKGHSVAALSIWNNMFEPVGAKKRSWHKGEPFECPRMDHPFIYTSKNSI